MTEEPPPSFSRLRKWSLSLNVLVSALAALALALMVNYLAARHYTRVSLSATDLAQLSPLTLRVLASVTNEVKVIVFFDKQSPLYDSVWALLKEYRFRNSKIVLEVVDHERDPGAANLVKARYRLSDLKDRDFVIFDAHGRTKFVFQNEMSDLDIQPLVSGQSKEIRRTHFKGELLFTSAIFGVSSLRPLKACFLEGHGEHSPESDDADRGYSKFADVLKQNNVEVSRITLVGTNDVPADCSLLILAAPTSALMPGELARIDQYLKNGGRLLALFNFYGVAKATGLERILANWGVEVGQNVVQDLPHSNNRQDVVTSAIGTHPIVRPLIRTPLYVVMPRSVEKATGNAGSAEGLTVSELVFTGPKSTVLTDIRNGEVYAHPALDLQTNVCLAVAVEKGKIRDVTAERGTTRIVVVGESLFWGNNMIEDLGNRDFASLAINWLLDRSQLLAIPPKPIKEYKLVMTHSQLSSVRWILLAGMPGAVLLLGLLVSVRRRK